MNREQSRRDQFSIKEDRTKGNDHVDPQISGGYVSHHGICDCWSNHFCQVASRSAQKWQAPCSRFWMPTLDLTKKITELIKKQYPQTKTEVTDRHRLNDNDIYNPCIYYCIEQASRVCFKMDFKFWGLNWHVGLFLFKSLKWYNRRVREKSFQVFRGCLLYYCLIFFLPFVSLVFVYWW